MAHIDQFLQEVLRRKGSDLHFLAGDPPRIRLYGDLTPLRAEVLTPDFAREALYEIMPTKAQARFEKQDGRTFWGTLSSAKVSERLIGAISVDGRRFVMADEDGTFDGTVATTRSTIATCM